MTDLMNQVFGPMRQTRAAERAGTSTTDYLRRSNTNYEGMQVSMRPSRQFKVGGRSAHFDTLFAKYIDLVDDPSRAKRKDSDIQNRMRQDLQVLGCLNVRKLATIQLERQWDPAIANDPTASTVAKQFERWFDKQYRVSETMSNMLDSILDGISIQEMVWKLDEDRYEFYIDRMFSCYKDRFVFSKDGHLALLTRSNVFYGELVHPWQFIKHVYSPSGGSWSNPSDEGRLYWGRGLEDFIYPNYFFKTVVLNLYTRWLQRLSNGVLIGRYPRRDKEGQATALELLEAYQEDEELIYPSGEEWSIEIKEATRAPADTYLAFIEYVDRQMSKAILGSTLIIDQGDVGSQSLGEVHERTTFGKISEFDRMGLEETMNRDVVPVMGQINHIPKNLWPTFRFQTDATKPAAASILESMSILQSLGFEVSAEMVTESTGFRKPKPGETILQAKETPDGGFGDLGLQGGPGGGLKKEFDVSKPEGLSRLRSVAYRAGKHVRGTLTYDLAEAGNPVHRHTANLDVHGNGESSRGPDGHGHPVRGWTVMPDGNGHSHDLLMRSSDIGRIVELITR